MDSYHPFCCCGVGPVLTHICSLPLDHRTFRLLPITDIPCCWATTFVPDIYLPQPPRRSFVGSHITLQRSDPPRPHAHYPHGLPFAVTHTPTLLRTVTRCYPAYYTLPPTARIGSFYAWTFPTDSCLFVVVPTTLPVAPILLLCCDWCVIAVSGFVFPLPGRWIVVTTLRTIASDCYLICCIAIPGLLRRLPPLPTILTPFFLLVTTPHAFAMYYGVTVPRFDVVPFIAAVRWTPPCLYYTYVGHGCCVVGFRWRVGGTFHWRPRLLLDYGGTSLTVTR